MAEVSKRTLGVFLLIAVILSVVGTYNVVMGNVIAFSGSSAGNTAQAEVSFGILEQPQQPQSAAVGKVDFKIQSSV